MKGILIEPGKAPEPANLPDTLSAMEARLGGTVETYIFPRTPAVLFYCTAGSPVNRILRGTPCAARSSATAGGAATSSRCPVPCSPRCWTGSRTRR